MVRFTIDLDRELRDRLKHQSIIEGETMKEIITKLIEDYLRRKENDWGI